MNRPAIIKTQTPNAAVNVRIWSEETGVFDKGGTINGGTAVTVTDTKSGIYRDNNWTLQDGTFYLLAGHGWVAAELVEFQDVGGTNPAPIALGILGLVIFAIIFGKDK